MKKITFLFLLACITVNAQKELWGVTRTSNFSDVQGNIVQFDINGENAVTKHHFNYPDGKLPQGKLFLASNGKLYGTATFGGINGTTNTTEQDGNGVLYEYDLIFDTYNVVHLFDGTLAAQVNPSSSLIEPIPGKLYGGTSHGGFYVYDIATETVSYLNHTYSFEAMGGIYSDLIKASNGFVYAVSGVSFPCTAADPQPNMGTVIEINTTTNTAQRVASFSCVGTDGAGSSSTLVEALPNKIFFTSGAGYQSLPDEGFVYPAGTIVEFNTLTNTLTPKITFDVFNSLGFSPSSFVMGDNGNLYGVCSNGGDTYRSPYTSGILNKTGTLFEYNPSADTIVKLTEFLPFRANPGTIIKLSTGDLMGNLGYIGLFNYDINTISLQFPDLATYSDSGNQFYTQNLIEICRKPSYHFFDVDTFNPCINTPFTFDVQNTNATSYTWKKDGEIVPQQTTGILNLPNVTAADSGDYTCEMVNECGTTVTMVLHINVGCLGIDEMAAYNKLISLYPNPTKDILNIKLPENSNLKIRGCTISNMLGQVVFESNSDNSQINVANYPTGLYSLVLKTDKGNWFGKFIKQ